MSAEIKGVLAAAPNGKSALSIASSQVGKLLDHLASPVGLTKERVTNDLLELYQLAAQSTQHEGIVLFNRFIRNLSPLLDNIHRVELY